MPFDRIQAFLMALARSISDGLLCALLGQGVAHSLIGRFAAQCAGERYAPDLRGIAVHTFGDKVPSIKILYNQKEIAVGTFLGKI